MSYRMTQKKQKTSTVRGGRSSERLLFQSSLTVNGPILSASCEFLSFFSLFFYCFFRCIDFWIFVFLEVFRPYYFSLTHSLTHNSLTHSLTYVYLHTVTFLREWCCLCCRFCTPRYPLCVIVRVTGGRVLLFFSWIFP